MLDQIIANITQFFSVASWVEALGTYDGILKILTLVVLEGVLSSDNAVVLAVMVRHLPEHLQKKALTYGMAGAYSFRFIAVILGTVLVKYWQLKVIGGGYLLYLALKPVIYKYFVTKKEDTHPSLMPGFWRTIIMVEAMDITFSGDSILAALGVSEKVAILFLGGILGIAMMRFAAVVFIKLLEMFPELEQSALVLIGFIGLKLLASAAGYHFSETLGAIIMLGILGGTIAYSALRQRMTPAAA